MPLVRRRTAPYLADIATVTNNDVKRVGAGASFHLDASETTVTAANGAGTLAAALTLVNQIKGVYNFHCADSLVLKAVDASPVATASAVDLATAITLANAIKAAYNIHRASATIHFNADATNTVATADATDQASLDTLCNDIKAKLNAHMASAPANSPTMIRLVPA